MYLTKFYEHDCYDARSLPRIRFLKPDQRTNIARPLDKRFWIIHLALPLAVAATVLFTLEHTGLDLWLADHWYAFEGNEWTLRHHWFTYDVIHHHGKQMILAIGLVLLVMLLASQRVPALQPWRKPMAYVLASMALLPSAIAFSKHYSPVNCPWDLTRYGGHATYQHTFDYTFAANDLGHCFPAGHASGGFALLALYFALYFYARKPALFLLPGLIVGFVFAIGQQARGAHFISHDMWSISFCWFGALGLFLLFRPGTWPQTVAVAASSGVRGR